MSYQIIDRAVYKTTHWTIESEDNTYHVQCQEGMFDDTWYINSDEADVDVHSDSPNFSLSFSFIEESQRIDSLSCSCAS